MNKQEFGKDPMDQYSVPLSETETRLSRIFVMPKRENPKKPGRSLSVLWDGRTPLIPDFENRYSYTVRFWEKGNIAGNHYHEQKEELFYPLEGDFRIILEDIETKEKEEIDLSAEKNQVAHIKTKIAHAVIAGSANSLFLVLATSPGTEDDEFPYQLTE